MIVPNLNKIQNISSHLFAKKKKKKINKLKKNHYFTESFKAAYFTEVEDPDWFVKSTINDINLNWFSLYLRGSGSSFELT